MTGFVDVFHHCCHYLPVMSERSTHNATLIDVDFKSRWIFEKEDRFGSAVSSELYFWVGI